MNIKEKEPTIKGISRMSSPYTTHLIRLGLWTLVLATWHIRSEKGTLRAM